MSKPRENRIRTLELTSSGEVPGISVIGFHGEVDAAHTPARRAPVLVDGEGWLVRLSPEDASPNEEAAAGKALLRVRIERGTLRVDAQAAILPGVGTKLGPWSARVGDTIMLLGEAERRAASDLEHLVTAGEPGVRRFLSWLAGGCPPDAPPRAGQVGSLTAWCCGQEEAHDLWTHILQEARLAVMTAFAQGQSPSELEKAAWWLSRAALSDEDLYLAAAALKHAGSPDAETMLQAMLQDAPVSEELQKRMTEQLLFLDAEARLSSPARASPAAHAPAVWPYMGSTPDRDRVRRRVRGAA